MTDADVRAVLAGGDEEAAKPQTDGSFRLWPGRYELVVKLADGDQMRDGPFQPEPFGPRAKKRD